MTDLNRVRKNKKITYTASKEGIEKAEKALKRLGYESKSNFAKSQLISRSTVTKFFYCQEIQLDSFKRICDGLKLSNWKEIAELPEKKESEPLRKIDCSKSVINEEGEMIGTNRRQVTVIDKEKEIIKAVITLEGDINSVSNIKILESILREHSGDTIKIIDKKPGSIKLNIEGSQEDIQQLIERIKSGELKEVNGFPIKDIQRLAKQMQSEELSNDDVFTETIQRLAETIRLEEKIIFLESLLIENIQKLEESRKLDNKWNLVQEIVSQGAVGRDLSGIDLSDTDLSGADLSNANLSGVDLSGADLSGADLSNANLSGADLSGADLSDVNLSGVDLSGVDLSGADLSNVNLSGANLSGVNLSGANLISAYLNGVNLSNANLISAYLNGVNLSNANLIGANLRNAYLNGANFRNAYLNGANLRNAYLSYVDLRNAHLNYANLRNANLNGADLRNADFSGINLIGANIERTQFGNNIGITKEFESNLLRRGAILEDSVPDDKRFDNKIFLNPRIEQKTHLYIEERTYTAQDGSTIIVLVPCGVLDATRSQYFRKCVISSMPISKHIAYVVVNLEQVTFMDSSGLGALVIALKNLRASETKLVLCSANAQVKILFELTGMDKVFEIFNTEKEAVGDTCQISHYNFIRNY